MATLTGDQFDNPLSGGAENDVIFGLGGNDTLSGNAGDDQIDGGVGNDIVDGGGGYDTARFTEATAGVYVDLRISGPQTVGGGLGVDTLISIEGIVGSANNDTLIGDSGPNNGLVGGAGNDLIDGGAGFDNAIYGGASGGVNVSLAIVGPQNVGGGEGIDTLLGIDGLIGSNHNDTLTGGDGGDALEGGQGDDLLNGAGGLDRVVYQNSAAGVTVNLNISGPQAVGGDQGVDTILNVEGIIGSAHGDTLTGNAGDNTFEGRGGDDRIDGGSGLDTASFSIPATSGVTVDLAVVGPQNIGGGQGVDTLISIERATGTNFGDTLSGNAETNILLGLDGSDLLSGKEGADNLVGGAGADTLDGGDASDFLQGQEGDDRLDGGAGADLASYFTATSGVTVNLALTGPQGVNGGQGVDTLVSIENVGGSPHADQLTGNGGDNSLFGLDGDDILTGGGGNDLIIGGVGTDTAQFTGAFTEYVLDVLGNGELVVTDQRAGSPDGVDTLLSVERLSFAGASVDVAALTAPQSITGAHGAGTVLGGLGNDTLGGGSGSDSISAGGGNDAIVGGSGSDSASGGSGNDTIDGGSGADVLSGDGGDDSLAGGAGPDTLAGGVGADTLLGGKGGDLFVFGTTSGNDRILDLSNGDHVSLIDGVGLASWQELNGDTVLTLTGVGATIILVDITGLSNADVTGLFV